MGEGERDSGNRVFGYELDGDLIIMKKEVKKKKSQQ